MKIAKRRYNGNNLFEYYKRYDAEDIYHIKDIKPFYYSGNNYDLTKVYEKYLHLGELKDIGFNKRQSYRLRIEKKIAKLYLKILSEKMIEGYAIRIGHIRKSFIVFVVANAIIDYSPYLKTRFAPILKYCSERFHRVYFRFGGDTEREFIKMVKSGKKYLMLDHDKSRKINVNDFKN